MLTWRFPVEGCLGSIDGTVILLPAVGVAVSCRIDLGDLLNLAEPHTDKHYPGPGQRCITVRDYSQSRSRSLR